VFFSANTEVGIREEVCDILDIMTESLSDKYLDFHAIVGSDRTDCFQYLIDRVNAISHGWREKMLSMRGKEILLNSIAQAIPLFAMLVFKIPKNIC
jgi:hypothetical protein